MPKQIAYDEHARRALEAGMNKLADAVREVQHLHSMGHITDWQMKQAQDAYAATIERVPPLGPPHAPETQDDERG